MRSLFVVLLFAVGLAGCDGGGAASSAGSTATNQSPGGIWRGTDSENDTIIALVTESGRFHFLETSTGNQGSGSLIVSDRNQISADFRFVPPVGSTLADGASYADCAAAGSVSERSSLSAAISCTTNKGSESSVSVTLTYDSLYELDSSLETFSGYWTDLDFPGIDGVTVKTDGTINGRDYSGTECDIDGQVSIIDSAHNAYEIEWSYSSCEGAFSALNGTTFSGIGAIDNSQVPIQFIAGATGILQNTQSSLILTYQRSGDVECSNGWQKDFALEGLFYWYLWNHLLPSDIDIADYATPESLVAHVTTTFGPQTASNQPIDIWSSVGSLQADQQFFGEGKYEGFGFRWRFEGPNMRIVSVYTDSPAGFGGLERGHTVITLNGRTVANIDGNEGIGTFFDENATVTFVVDDVSGMALPPIQITKDIVTIDPIPQWRMIDIGPGVPPVGYMEFETFISTANPVFDQAFADFNAADVRDVVLDLRYNGGGLVSTAKLLGDYLGGFANDSQVFSNTEFNAERAPQYNATSYFARLGNSIDLRRLIVIASGLTASASELVTNALDPYAESVWIVGDNTYGKPVGQVGMTFCEKILRPTSFKTTNAAGYGDYFDGLPVDCPAADLLEVPVGADNDPNVIAAVSISETGACPIAAVPDGQQAAPVIRPDMQYPDLTGPPEREFAGAF